MINTARVFWLAVLISVMGLVACASRPLVVNPDVNVVNLGICVDFDEHIELDEKLLYLNATKEFVEQSAGGDGDDSLSVAMCNRNQPHQLTVTVQHTRFVDPAEQALYVVLSTAGILYPLNGGHLGFAWLGFSTSNLELHTSPNLAVTAKPVYTQIYSSPYFLSAEGVRVKHMERFKNFLAETVRDIGRQLQAVAPPTLDTTMKPGDQ